MKPSTEAVFQTYADRLFAIAFTVCQNREDAEDAMQEVFLRLLTAKQIRSSFWRRNQTAWVEELTALPFEEPADSQLFEAVMGLDEKYRIVVHMFYYEDYDIREIAQILRCPSGTVKSRLSRARALLKDRLKEDWNND